MKNGFMYWLTFIVRLNLELRGSASGGVFGFGKTKQIWYDFILKYICIVTNFKK